MLNKKRDWNTNTVNDASGLFHGTACFQFVVCLIVVSRCLEITRPLTKQLQASTLDVVESDEKISLLYASLQRLRQEISTFHACWFEGATKLASSVNVETCKPRTVQRQIHRQKAPAESVSQYYERNLTLPFVAHLMVEIQNRFLIAMFLF